MTKGGRGLFENARCNRVSRKQHRDFDSRGQPPNAPDATDMLVNTSARDADSSVTSLTPWRLVILSDGHPARASRPHGRVRYSNKNRVSGDFRLTSRERPSLEFHALGYLGQTASRWHRPSPLPPCAVDLRLSEPESRNLRGSELDACLSPPQAWAGKPELRTFRHRLTILMPDANFSNRLCGYTKIG